MTDECATSAAQYFSSCFIWKLPCRCSGLPGAACLCSADHTGRAFSVSPLGPPIGTAAKYRLPSSSVSRWPRVWWNTIGFPDLLFARVVVEISVSRMRPVRVRRYTRHAMMFITAIYGSVARDRKGPGTEGLNASPANTAPATSVVL